MQSLRRDLSLAFRRLGAAPGFSLFVIISIAVGVGATTAIYAVLYSLLWRPLLVTDPHQIVDLTQGGRPSLAVSWSDFSEFRSNQSVFSGLAASQQIQVAVVDQGVAEAAFAEAINGEYFATLGVSMRIGRPIQVADEDAAAPPVVVVSEGFWRSKSGADPNFVGRTLKIAGHSFEVIGVANGSFRGVTRYLPTRVWVPLSTVQILTHQIPSPSDPTGRSMRMVSVKGRLRPGTAPESAAAAVSVIGRRLETAHPSSVTGAQPRAWSVIRNTATVPSLNSTVGGIIACSVWLVLIVACSNIANLSLARGSTRIQEFALRTALGASRWQIVREQLVESGVLVSAGGIAAAFIADRLMTSWSVNVPIGQGTFTTLDPEFSVPVLATTVGALALSLVVCGMWPALQLTRSHVRGSFASGASATPVQWKLHRRLVVWQVTGAVALFQVAWLCMGAVFMEATHNSGVEVDRLAIAQADFQISGRNEDETRRAVSLILQDAGAQPGIDGISASVGLPFGVVPPRAYVTLPERPFDANREVESTRAYSVISTAELFRTLGVSLRAGRSFDDRDAAASQRVAVVSESLARALFNRTDVVGRTLLICRMPRPSDRYPSHAVAVIGVAGDTDVRDVTKRGHLLYVPLLQESATVTKITFTARTSGEPETAVVNLLGAIRRVDPGLAVTAAGTGSMMLEGPYFIVRTVGALAVILGSTALVLAMIGLYGVLSYAVMRRGRELGVRMALGADSPRITRLVMRDGTRPVLEGLVLGLVAGVVGRLAVQPAFLQPISPIDPVAFSLVPIPLFIVAALACYLPARRAARVDPNVVLREL